MGSEVPSDSDTLNVVDALAQLNDKKANKLGREVRFYNGEDRTLDFILTNVYVRIQGTSSVNYASASTTFSVSLSLGTSLPTLPVPDVYKRQQRMPA